MKNKFTFLLIISMQCCFFTVKSQLNPVPRWQKSPGGKYACFTDEMEKYRNLINGATQMDDAVFERWMKGQVNEVSNTAANARTNPIIYTIPIIFHIIHENTETPGIGRNIGQNFINAQIQQLNNDFRRTAGTSGFNNHPFGADVEIQFCAATLTPANAVLQEPGIERINRLNKGWTAPPHLDTYVQTVIKPNSFWDPNQYLNVWVCDLTDSSGQTLGYAQFPQYPGMIGQDEDTATLASTDGIVLHYSVVGSSTLKVPGSFPYDEGRILTHEIGHFFGLRHIWGEGNCTHDDYVFDTPRQNDIVFGCPAANTNTCDDTQFGSAGDSVDMVKNYMQVTDNNCVNIFTIGQKNRMRVIMGESGLDIPRRSSLRFSDRCQTKPKVSLVFTDTAVLEKTGCNAAWGFNIPVHISRKPTASTNVTLNRSTGNTDGMDFTVSPDSVSFSPTDTADKYFSVSMNPDAVFEGHEKEVLYLHIADTFATAAPDPYELIIYNDDYGPVLGKRIMATIFFENFTTPSAGWLKHDYIQGENRWTIGGTNGDVYDGASAYISKDSSSLAYKATSESHTILYHEINAYHFDSLYLSFYDKCKGEKINGVLKDFGKVMYSLDSLNFFQVPGTEDYTDSSNSNLVSLLLPSFLWHQKFYLGFYWQNDNTTANNPPFAIDDVSITGKTNTIAQINTTVDTTFGFDQKPVGPFETVHFYDKVTGNILASMQDMGGYNWGCVTVEQDRAGTGAQWITGDPQVTPRNKIMDKTYKITPVNNNTSGNYKITFYLTQNEVFGWTGASTWPSVNALRILKYAGAINNITYTSTYEQVGATKAAYLGGTDYTITANFNTGFSGFGFGNIQPVVLPVQLLSFTGSKLYETAILNWKVNEENNMLEYHLQHSEDGLHFNTIYRLPATGGNTGSAYQFTDINPVSGTNYYRLQMIQQTGSSGYSNIVSIQFPKVHLFRISPSPFHKSITINYKGFFNEKATITIIDANGKRLLKKVVMLNGFPLNLHTADLPNGFYSIRMTTDKYAEIQKIIKQ